MGMGASHQGKSCNFELATLFEELLFTIHCHEFDIKTPNWHPSHFYFASLANYFYCHIVK